VAKEEMARKLSMANPCLAALAAQPSFHVVYLEQVVTVVRSRGVLLERKHMEGSQGQPRSTSQTQPADLLASTATHYSGFMAAGGLTLALPLL
jgi:hypothetical protein